MLAQYNENYTHYTSRSGDTQLLLYRRKSKTKTEYIKQRILGLTLAAVGVIIPFILEGDATASLIALPLGLYLVFTKENLMHF